MSVRVSVHLSLLAISPCFDNQVLAPETHASVMVGVAPTRLDVSLHVMAKAVLCNVHVDCDLLNRVHQADREMLSLQKARTDGRVSKSGRQADTRLRKIFHKLRKILTFERETVKIISFNLILLILTHFFCVLLSFWQIIMRKFCWLDILTAQ